MSYCRHCGGEIDKEAVICPMCGCETGHSKSSDKGTMYTIAKILAILSCVSVGLFIIPLIWMIPMTVKMFDMEKNHEVPSTAFCVFTLLFLNTISGILLFIIKEDL